MQSTIDNPTTVAVNNVATYRTPILAVYRNNLVRIIATGDMPGRSPVLQFVDGNGNIGWDSTAHFIVADPAFLPPDTNTYRNVNQKLTPTSNR